MENKIYNNIVLLYLIFVLLLIQCGGILLTYSNIDGLYYSKALFYVSVLGGLLYLFYKMKVNKFEIKDFFVILFVFFSLLSFYFAYDRYVAYVGFIGRREGLLVLIAYYIYFLVASTLKNKRCLKVFIIFFSIHVFLQIIYGFLQVCKVNNFLGVDIKYNWFHYAFGLVGNSNFFSTLQVLIFGIWFGIYMFDYKLFDLKKMIIMEIFLVGLILSGAMSGFIAFVMIILAVIIYILFLYFKKNEKIFKYIFKLGLLFVLFIWNMVFLSHFAYNQYALDIFDLGVQTSQISNDGLKDENGTGRIYIWKIALKNAPRYLLTGIGIDQFFYINDGEIIEDPVTGNVIDKAHNEYLQILLTEGIFKCITYIIFLLWIFLKACYISFKSKEIDAVFIGLFFAFCGYSIQAFFNISVTRVAPIFFIISGLLLSQIDSKSKVINEVKI